MKRALFQKRSMRMPQRGREAQNEEYGREVKGIIECPKCKNISFQKRWVASLDQLAKKFKIKPHSTIKEKFCPACTMIENNVFEGELIVENFPEHTHTELMNLIFNFGMRAKERDPQDRIIALEKGKDRFRVTTTENQLVDRLGKKIKEVFNTVAVSFSHSKEPYEVARVRAVFTGA